MRGITAITGGRRGIGTASAMRRTGRNAVREARARVERQHIINGMHRPRSKMQHGSPS